MYKSPYGGYNDRALTFVSGCMLEDAFLLRALESDGTIMVHLNCNDIFAWATADTENLPPECWFEFERSLRAARDEFGWDSKEVALYADAWAVKLRKVAPQKPVTDKYPAFVHILDFLEIPWRDWKRYDEM